MYSHIHNTNIPYVPTVDNVVLNTSWNITARNHMRALAFALKYQPSDITCGRVVSLSIINRSFTVWKYLYSKITLPQVMFGMFNPSIDNYL